jgi:hypothetical protein
LKRLYEEKKDKALTKEEEKMSINLCLEIAKSRNLDKLGEIYVVTTTNRLKLARNVVNLNLEWKTSSFVNSNYDIVHQEIAPKTAKLLGISSKYQFFFNFIFIIGCKNQRNVMYEDVISNFENFGQKVDLINEIKQIVIDYGETFVEEMVKIG